MTIRIINSVKYIGLFALVLVSVIACERDFENIGVTLVDNNQFTTKDISFEVVAYNKSVDSSQVNQDIPTTPDIDGLTQYLLGVNKSDNFGLIKTAFITQMGLSGSIDFGDNVSIDAVILNIPYYATKLDDNSNGTPNFKLDSIIGDQEEAYLLSVFESGTFLNALDPQDPTKIKKYYSNQPYSKRDQLYSAPFKPNKNDTVLYVNRRFLDADASTVDDIDTIKVDNVAPSIKLPLDTLFFRNNFINQQNSGMFDSFDNFVDSFKGIIVEAEGTKGSLMTLAMSDANITLYYTNTELKDENGTDLNNNGSTDETDVPVRTKQRLVFPVAGLRTSQYTRDFTSGVVNTYLTNPDSLNGEDKLFVQGAAGTISVLKLFKGVDADSLNALRSKNWLINEANLVFNIDETSSSNVPERLLLYRLDDKSQILDVFSEGQLRGIGGILERNDNNEPLRYKFRITDYISEVLKSDNPLTLEKLGLKVFHPSDVPSALIANDTLIKDFSWIAKGVVLKGNNLPLTDTKRIKLEIFYTINNE